MEDRNGTSHAVFHDLNAEIDTGCTEIESLCMNCHANGITRLLLAKIPHYKELVLMSFLCDHCGYENNEIQSGGAVGDMGIKIKLNVCERRDLNRQIVRSDYTSVKIPEIDFEVPAQSQKGSVTTVEGVIDRAVAGLEQDQEVRRKEHPEIAGQIDGFICKLKELKMLKQPWTMMVEDISGNSHIENPNAPHTDANVQVNHFKRTKEQDHVLGIFTRDEVNGTTDVKESKANGILHPIDADQFTIDDLHGEVLQFPTICHGCGAPCQTNMKVTKIPHFKETIIMATTCDRCGHKTNEVKSGGGIEERGVRFVVKVRGVEDFGRDILKSETCSLSIPELDLEVGSRALGGRFTTVEGLLQAIKDQLGDSTQSHVAGDSSDPIVKERYEQFFKALDQYLTGKKPFTLVMDDPAGNSYVQSFSDDGDEADAWFTIERYVRSHEQNEELGLNDMKTENYDNS